MRIRWSRDGAKPTSMKGQKRNKRRRLIANASRNLNRRIAKLRGHR